MDLKSAQFDAYFEWLQDRGLTHPVLRDGPHQAIEIAPETSKPETARPKRIGLAECRADVMACMACGLSQTRRAPVFGYGGEAPRVVFIGDGPLAAEDVAGEAFTGAERELIEKIAGAMRLAPHEAYFTTALHCKMPAERLPPSEAFAACRRHLVSLLSVLKPRGVVVMGMVATRAIFGERTGFHELRGCLHTRPELSDAAWLVTYHPRDLLRHPAAKREAWADLLKLMGRLG